MSDEAVVAAETAAPAEAPVEAVEAPQQNAANIRQGVRERARGNVAARVNEGTAQARNELGQFASTQEPDALSPEAAVDAPAGESETAEQAVEETPSGLVKVKLVDDHPLRHRLGAEVEVPEKIADLVRWANNNAIRQSEVATTRGEMRQWQERAMRAEAEATALREQRNGVLTGQAVSPEVFAQAKQIAEAWGEEAGQRYLQAHLADLDKQVTDRSAAADSEFQQQLVQQQGLQFVQEVYRDATEGYSPEITQLPGFKQALDRAREMYGNAISIREERGEAVQLSKKEFFDILNTQLTLTPDVVQVLMRQREATQASERERIAKEVEEQRAKQEREQLEQQSALRRKNPHGRIPSSVQTGQTVQTEAPKTAASIRQQVRNRVRGIAG